MHPEVIGDITRRRFAQWAHKLDTVGATPSFVAGVSQTEPDGVVMCIHPALSVPDLRRMLLYCLSELDTADPPELP